MLRHLAIDVSLGALLVGIWYWACLQFNRRRCSRILAWIESAFGTHGQVAAVRWLSASRFHVQLRLANCGFKHPAVQVQLAPRELPLRWLLNRWRKRQETLTFEANLHCPPNFNLDVQNHRWCGRSRRNLPTDPKCWTTERLAPIVIASRSDTPRDVANMMSALGSSRDCDFLNVSFRRSSPHFSATVPLTTLAPESQSGTPIFDALRELAAGASASRF
jgi:hypothetical protein